MNLLKIGLTGGIASGKSHVSSLFAKLGITIIDADKIARGLFADKSPYLTDLKNKFGKTIFNDDNSLNRSALRNIVFNDPHNLKWLNQFTHPKVTEQIDKELKLASSPYVILDIPLLIDLSGNIPAHLNERIDRVLVISVKQQTQIKRLCARDNISTSDALKIISSQSSLKQKLAHANDTIDNNGQILDLDPQIKQLHQQYLKLAASLAK